MSGVAQAVRELVWCPQNIRVLSAQLADLAVENSSMQGLRFHKFTQGI
jgi:hypothetical protein